MRCHLHQIAVFELARREEQVEQWVVPDVGDLAVAHVDAGEDVAGVSPATLMGPPFRHEHGTTSSLTVPVARDASGPARRCQPVGLVRVRGVSVTLVSEPARGFCRLR